MLSKVKCLILLGLTSLLVGITPLLATHQKAAEITFVHVGGYTYDFLLTTYTFTGSEADRPELDLFWGDGSSSLLSRYREELITETQTKINYYQGRHTYSGPGFYYISMEDANRNGGVVNMPNSIMTPMYVETLLVISPWLEAGNSSPILLNRPVDDKACLGKRFIHNPGAYDPDGDSLSFQLVPCRTTGGEIIAGYQYPFASHCFSVDSLSGDMIWDVPLAQGEYNVAMLIREWRKQLEVGSITRDMQITVQTCDNIPPDLFLEDNYCVEAGKKIEFEIVALDVDGDKIKITANGEMLHHGWNAGIQSIYQGIDSSRSQFYWTTDLANSRKEPYRVYFKATDNGNPNLSDIKMAYIRVIAPEVEHVKASAQLKAVEVQWDKSISPHANAYAIYRREGPSIELVEDPCKSGLDQEGYSLIATLKGADHTQFVDRFALQEGMKYGYKIVVLFADGSESYPSKEACAEILNYTPIITHVSIEKTDTYKGVVKIAWVEPMRIDTSSLSTYSYRLFKGYGADSLFFYRAFPLDSVVVFWDSNLNTAGTRPYYQVYIDTLAGSKASSVYLTAVPYTRRNYLSWSCEQPWFNRFYTIYRYNSDKRVWDTLAKTKQREYTDRNLSNDSTYFYFVEASGTYYSDRIPGPLLNASNIISAKPRLAQPCKPYIYNIKSECNPLQNTINWSLDSAYIPDTKRLLKNSQELEDCYEDLSHYLIYYKRLSEKDFSYIGSTEEPVYTHHAPSSYFGCYRIVAVNTDGQESEASPMLCSDNRECFHYELPNVFTPNGDGVNDVFRALPNQYVEGFHIVIVNIEGVVVYQSDNPAFEWNGKFYGNGRNCSDGAYFYTVNFSANAEGIDFRSTQRGSITLLR
ncbi:MAG: gliding motility-associated C-terminal domain-containing protein [Bacteroidales bacterium]